MEVLWRLAKVSHALGSIAGAKGDASKKKELILKGEPHHVILSFIENSIGSNSTSRKKTTDFKSIKR